MDLTTLSLEELKDNLLTTDYKGKEYKEACLEELIDRATKKVLADRFIF